MKIMLFSGAIETGGFYLNWFDIVVGVSTVCSLIVAIIALIKVDRIQKHIISESSNKTKQTIKKTQIHNSEVRQVGRDSKDDQ